MKSNRFGLSFISALSALAFALAIVGPRFLQQKQKKTARVAAEDAKVQNVLIAAKGVVESEEEVEISSQVIGIISAIQVAEGDMVKKGQLLVRLDDHKIMIRVKLSKALLKEAIARLRVLEAGYRDEDIEIAQSRLKRKETLYEKAKDEYERQKMLYQKEANTLINFEKAEEKREVAAEDLNEAKINLKKLLNGTREEEIEQAKASVERASLELDYYRALLKDYAVRSPLDGLVAEVYLDTGEMVDIGTPLLKIINPNKLRIRAELEETDVGQVVEGQQVEASTDAYRDRIYRGSVNYVSPVLKKYSIKAFDPSAAYDINAQDIYLTLNDFSRLKNGMLVTVRFLQ